MNISVDDIYFQNPKRIVYPTCWVEFIPLAFKLIDFIRPKSIVELGTHSGNSFCAFNQAINYLKLDSICYAIDSWQGDIHSGFYNSDVFYSLNSYCSIEYPKSAILLKTSFDIASTKFKDKSVDLLHIDGLHTYEAVKHDFLTWLTKMSDKGIVLFHDICVIEKGFGVHKFWGELQSQYEYVEFRNGNGLGVLFVGGNINTELKEKILDLSENKVWRQLIEMKGLYLAQEKNRELLELEINTQLRIVEGYKKSVSYKVGKILLYPFKELAYLFK